MKKLTGKSGTEWSDGANSILFGSIGIAFFVIGLMLSGQFLELFLLIAILWGFSMFMSLLGIWYSREVRRKGDEVSDTEKQKARWGEILSFAGIIGIGLTLALLVLGNFGQDGD